jgi:hypothetical protein
MHVGCCQFRVNGPVSPPIGMQKEEQQCSPCLEIALPSSQRLIKTTDSIVGHSWKTNQDQSLQRRISSLSLNPATNKQNTAINQVTNQPCRPTTSTTSRVVYVPCCILTQAITKQATLSEFYSRCTFILVHCCDSKMKTNNCLAGGKKKIDFCWNGWHQAQQQEFTCHLVPVSEKFKPRLPTTLQSLLHVACDPLHEWLPLVTLLFPSICS